MYDRILVAVDHSEMSDRAVRAARDLAVLSKGAAAATWPACSWAVPRTRSFTSATGRSWSSAYPS